MAIDTKKYDDIFKRASDKYKMGAKAMLVLKSIVMVESTFRPRAYRFKPEFFKRLIKKEPWWADKDPSIVSASYGLPQILFTTAWALGMKPTNWKTLNHAGFQALAERLYDPEVCLFYEAQLVRALIDKVWADGIPHTFEHLSAMDVALARYNGGSYKNPDEAGVLDEQKYVDKVWRAHKEILAKEKA
jgi:hypothetical protein